VKNSSLSGVTVLTVVGFSLLLVFTILPIGYSIYLSFFEFKFGRFVFTGISNYVQLLQNELFKSSLVITLYYTIGSLVPSIALALALAWALNRTGVIYSILRSTYFFPVAISPVVAAAIWRAFLNPDVGLANYVLELLGLPKFGWYTTESGALLTLIIVTIWKNVGYYMVILLAGLQNIPKELYEAARLDGANEWRTFWHIALPLLKPSLTFVYIVGFIFSFNVFDLAFVLTKGGPGYATMVTVYYLYREGFIRFRVGYAAAISTVLLIIVFLFILSQMRFLKTIGTATTQEGEA